MNWIKKNNKFIRPSNDINYNDFVENLNKFDTPNDSYVYIPTHNVNDTFEWYRIFNDSYAFTNNFDEYGFAIHGWFSKKRGQSIDGWFPNLFEVKATSSDIKEYYVDLNNDFFRRSIDYIDNFNTVEDLTIDGVEILNNDIVLIKNQNYEQLVLYTIDQQLSNDTFYYSQITSNDTQYFEIGNDIVFKTSTGEYIYDKIINIQYTIISGNDFIIIQTENVLENVVELADLNAGNWLFNTQDAQNGIYRYNGESLFPIIYMYDKYQTYNQIVYTYLGNTNQNKEYYLRRIENITSPNFSTYPYTGQGEPLIYSEGNAQLVKCRLNYDLSIEDNVQTIDPNCCFCNLQEGDPQVAHPTSNPPYDINSTAFRLLFLDNSIAEKIFSSDELGVGTYVIDNNIDINDPLNDISFDINQQILEDLYYNTPVIPTNNFVYQELFLVQSYEIVFDDYLTNGLNITQNTTTISGNTYVQTTTIELLYNNINKFPANTFQVGDYVHIKIENDNVLLDYTFVVVSATLDSNGVILEIYQPLDEEIINTIKGKDVKFTIKSINRFGFKNNLNLDDNRANLLQTINNSIIGKIYEFTILLDGGNYFLEFKKIRQNLKHKYFDLKCDIVFDATNYVIDSDILANYREYFYGYNIEDYLIQYLGLQQSSLPHLETTAYVYEDNILSQDRFDIFGSNKTNQHGNIITFGRTYKEVVLDKIKKHTLIKVLYDSYPTEENIFIYDVFWDEELDYGKIILSKEIQRPAANGENITLEPYINVNEISDKLKIIFDKKINNISDPNFVDYPDYRIETTNYAHAFMNYANNSLDIKDEILNNITGMFYNSHNELQVSFLKRDRFFDFSDDIIINVEIATTTNIDINTPPSTIDGYTLLNGDLVLVKDQTDATENGIYVYDSGNLTRYETFRKNIYWNILNGTLTNTTLTAHFDDIFIPGTSVVTFVKKSFKTKSDPRLTLQPVELYKLGIDNETQPPIKINRKYDLLETEENLVNIQPGINAQQEIRFIDGLTENNILNDIDGQGQYAWILDENVITNNAVVGCTQTNGPGTGDLIWYTGTWIQGLWCDGIWVQGEWLDGIWLNGTRMSNVITDNYYNVIITNTVNNQLSIWKTGTWYNGTNENGIFQYVDWKNGIFNNGVIQTGLWEDGTFNNGRIEYIIWEKGSFFGGDFLTGIWKNGLFEELDSSIPARFGYGATNSTDFKTRAIWRTGEFKAGGFYSGLNNQDHNLSIWYSGNFSGGIFYGGSFISGNFSGLWKDGVWFGGYYIISLTNTTNDDIELIIDPEQYDNVLELTTLTDYVANTKHNLHLFEDNFILFAIPDTITLASEIAFINIFYINSLGTYTSKPYVTDTATDTSLELTITNEDITNTYQQPDPSTDTLDGNPIVCATFNGTFESGIWLHGYFGLGDFQSGIWINGFFNNGDFGVIEY